MNSSDNEAANIHVHGEPAPDFAGGAFIRGPSVSSFDGQIEDHNIQENIDLLFSHHRHEPPYNDYSEAKESDVPNLVPPPHKKNYEALYRDSENTTATPIISESIPSAITSSTYGQVARNLGGNLETFPMKLHRMLGIIEDLGYMNIISWKVHGRAFQVHDVDQFVKLILPKFFRQSQISSFQRQLNLYGFRRFLNGFDTGAYYHELFLREKLFLCKAIFRTKVKGTTKRRKAAELLGLEPGFYQMNNLPTLQPLHQKFRLQSFFNTEEDLGHFKTFLSNNAVVRTRQKETISKGKRKRKGSLDDSLVSELNVFDNQQSPSIDNDAYDERKRVLDIQRSSRRKVTSENGEMSLNSTQFGFRHDSLTLMQGQQMQETGSQHNCQHSLESHQLNSSTESTAGSPRRSNNNITNPSTKNIDCQSYMHHQLLRSVAIDLTPAPIHVIQQNEQAHFKMMLFDEDFKNLFRNLLKSNDEGVVRRKNEKSITAH